MSHDEFTKLFQYMEAFKSYVEKRFEKVDYQFVNVHGEIAELSSRVDDYHNETLALSRQVDELRGSID